MQQLLTGIARIRMLREINKTAYNLHIIIIYKYNLQLNLVSEVNGILKELFINTCGNTCTKYTICRGLK